MRKRLIIGGIVWLALSISAAFGAFVSVELPPPYTPEDIARREPGCLAAIHEAEDRALENRPKGISYVVGVTFNGKPIMLDAAKLKRAGRKAGTRNPSGEINYIQGYGWDMAPPGSWQEVLYHIYSVHDGGAYNWLKVFYGQPLLGQDVTINLDTSVNGGYYSPGQNALTLDVGGLSPGVYVYTVKAGPNVASRKLVVAP